jgi:hypothetical protein
MDKMPKIEIKIPKAPASFSTLERELCARFVGQPKTEHIQKDLHDFLRDWVRRLRAQGDVSEKVAGDLLDFLISATIF